MVTLKDIARECKVSFSTVSKALKGSPEISIETTDFIKKKAQEMGYHPNIAARSLRTNRTYDIGVIFEDKTGAGFQHQYFATIINEGGGFTQDFSIAKTTDDPTATNFREQFLSYASVAEAENEFKKANGINDEGYTTFQANGTSYVKGEIRSQSTDIISEFTTFQTQNHVSAINTKH